MRIIRCIVIYVLLQVSLCTFAADVVVGADADSLMQRLFYTMDNGEYKIGESLCKLYVKQYANLDKWNLGLNFIPGMTRFDRREREYLTELFYNVHLLDYTLPAVRRVASVTTHRHGSGEMERVMSFMVPDISDDKLFEEGYLSPLHKVHSRYYIYSLSQDSVCLRVEKGCSRVDFKTKIDNIKLFTKGWVLLDDSCRLREFYAEGWDEQCKFSVRYILGEKGLKRNMVHKIELSIKYKFAWNRLDIIATGVYDYELLLQLSKAEKKRRNYNLTGITAPVELTSISDYEDFVTRNRQIPLTVDDSALYIRKGVIKKEVKQHNENNKKKRKRHVVVDWLWTFGDQMISSHSLNWNGGNLKFSPVIKPSYLSYSSSRGLSYKTSLNLKHRLKNQKSLSLRPMAGYNFKQNAFYWDIDGRFRFDPLNLGEVIIDVGSGNRTYSSVVLDEIKKIAYDSLNFSNLELDYFKNIYAGIGLKREISNGLEMLVGVNYYKRKLIGALDERLEYEGIKLQRKYTQFAPHIRVTWQPGMYYYIKNGEKVNVGSRMPRFVLDVEQGVKGFMGATSEYTRTELDVQYNYKVNETDALYLRGGVGGFIYTKDVYFADYAFLRQNNLPVDRSDELDGTFQLLDSEWYNAANRYVRFHATYESPFFVLQRALPRVNFFKNERIYLNMLFISHLTPYSEIGYGVETPYIDTGFFVNFENHKFRGFGYKVNISLFRDR